MYVSHPSSNLVERKADAFKVVLVQGDVFNLTRPVDKRGALKVEHCIDP